MPPTHLRIVVVENDRALLEPLTEAGGYTVESTADGWLALTRIEAEASASS